MILFDDDERSIINHAESRGHRDIISVSKSPEGAFHTLILDFEINCFNFPKTKSIVCAQGDLATEKMHLNLRSADTTMPLSVVVVAGGVCLWVSIILFQPSCIA